jgi:hypothetical protein
VAREIIQHAVIAVIQPQVVRYTCDFCHRICGTRGNPKSTWYVAGTSEVQHYCKRTCHPGSGEEVLGALAELRL